MTTHSHKKTPYLWHAFSAMLILTLVVTYLVQINSQATQSFAIKELEERAQVLNAIIEDREIEAAAAQSLSRIAARAKELLLQDPQDISFIKVNMSAVAVGSEITP